MTRTPGTSPSISVILCTFNRCDSLAETLQVLQAQAPKSGTTLEVLVVDNNSTDRTKQVVQAAVRVSRWPMRYLFEPRQGQSHARNLGIREAQGELIVFTDDDVIPEPAWIDRLVAAFAAHQADCVGGKILPLWSEPPARWMEQGPMRQQVWDSLALLDRGNAVRTMDMLDANFLYGANLAFRRQVFDELGLFRTDLGRVGASLTSGDDSELLQRMFRAGKRVVYVPEAVVHHKVQPERMRLSYFRRWRFAASQSAGRMGQAPRRAVPVWLIRECLANGCGALWAYATRRTETGMQRDLLFWTQLGLILGNVRQRWVSSPQSA